MKRVLVYGGVTALSVVAGWFLCVLLLDVPVTFDVVMWQLIPGALLGVAATLVIGYLVDRRSR